MNVPQSDIPKLRNTTIQALMGALDAARDEDGKPARSLTLEMDLDNGETVTVTVSRKKTESLDPSPGLS